LTDTTPPTPKTRLPAMNTNTVQTDPTPPSGAHQQSERRKNGPIANATRAPLLAVGLALFAGTESPAATVLNPWVPIFKGIEYAVGTNTPGSGGFADLEVVYCLRVNLTDPDLSLYASPRYSTYASDYTETAGYTTTNFLKNHGLQVAIAANQFYQYNSTTSPDYLLTEGTSFNVDGLFISRGVLVSPQDSAEESAAFLFTSSNSVTFIPTNWPAASTAGIYTAVSGTYPILYKGVNLGSNYLTSGQLSGLNPRTAFGLSQDRHYLFLLVIDGRQSGYSDGAYDWETAAWLKLAGASDGANMDGGGSSCIVVQDTTGLSKPLNHDSASAAVGRERTVGAHFGIYAKPVPGFFTNVTVLSDDTAATMTWTTISAATTQLEYGTTTNMTLLTTSNSTLTTSHAVLLTNLTPNTSYYYAPLASIGTNIYTSPTYLFTTTNYVTTNMLFDFTNTWTYSTDDLDGLNWTASSYDDSGWEGSGPGLLWVDNRGPNSNISDLNTEMTYNSGGYPYITYYFRTHFNYTNSPVGVALQMQAYIDDGAVFYLNGTEIWSLRMPSAPILNSTLASSYPCSGDATCIDANSVSGSVVTNSLVVGDNVLAVEVHNFNAASPDITFGLAVSLTVPYSMNPTLSVAWTNNSIVLNWPQGGYTLQQASAIIGPWTNVSGPVISSPFTITNSGNAQYFRLIK